MGPGLARTLSPVGGEWEVPPKALADAPSGAVDLDQVESSWAWMVDMCKASGEGGRGGGSHFTTHHRFSGLLWIWCCTVLY